MLNFETIKENFNHKKNYNVNTIGGKTSENQLQDTNQKTAASTVVSIQKKVNQNIHSFIQSFYEFWRQQNSVFIHSIQ